MKIALFFNSLLLKKSLESYLDGHIVSQKYADLILSDRVLTLDKNVLLVGHGKDADLRVPFSKAELFWFLEDYYLKMLDSISLDSKRDIKPYVERLNRKKQSKLDKIARNID